MRVLILDDDQDRAGAVKTVLRSKLEDRNISTCRSPHEVTDTTPAFDFVVLHFRNEGMGNGANAYAFLDGLIDKAANEPMRSVQREYFALGHRIRTTTKRTSVLVYSGGGVSESERDCLLDYGPNVCIRAGVGSRQLSDDLSMSLRRAFKTGELAFDLLCAQNTPFPLVFALLILCEGWLIANVNPTTGLPELSGGEADPVFPEFMTALKKMTGQTQNEVPAFVSSVLPAELMDRNRLATIRRSVTEPAWWQAIAQPSLTRAIRQEVALERISSQRLVSLLKLLSLIENKKPILDVGIVASAYNAASSLINGL